MSEAGCSSGAPDILEQLQPSTTDSRSLTIGLPASGPGDPDRRFPLTPEGVAILTDRGYRIKIEEGPRPLSTSPMLLSRGRVPR